MGRLTPAKRQTVLDRDGWQCRMPVCLHPEDEGGRAIDPELPPLDPWGASVDHIVQLSRGGTDGLGNLRAAHRECNEAAGRRGGDHWPRSGLPPVARNMRPDVYDRLRQAERDARTRAAQEADATAWDSWSAARG